MTCNDFYSAPRRPYNERIGVRIYRNILVEGNELIEACRVRRGIYESLEGGGVIRGEGYVL